MRSLIYIFSLHSFYRFVLEPDVAFLANDTASPGPFARFEDLPESPLLTLNMITPESWMVQAKHSLYDLDNIHLQEVWRCLVIAALSFLSLWVDAKCFYSPPREFCCFAIYYSLQVNGVVAAEFELEHLLLEGHCFDLSTGQPPRGLQFTLGMSQDPLMYDTIVMANLVSIFLGFLAMFLES